MAYDRQAYDQLQEHGRRKRHDNLEKSTNLLKIKGYKFTSYNDGIHLVVEDRFNFWPSTGLFIEIKTHERGRGIFKLIKLLK